MSKKKPSSSKKSPSVKVEDLKPQNNPKGGTLSSQTIKLADGSVKLADGSVKLADGSVRFQKI